MGKILGIISSSLLMTENVITCYMLSVGAIHFEDRFCSRRRGWIIEGGGWGHLVDITDGWAVLAGCRMVQSFLSPSPPACLRATDWILSGEKRTRLHHI